MMEPMTPDVEEYEDYAGTSAEDDTFNPYSDAGIDDAGLDDDDIDDE